VIIDIACSPLLTVRRKQNDAARVDRLGYAGDSSSSAEHGRGHVTDIELGVLPGVEIDA